MEIRFAKILDEACNRENEAFTDEVLQAAWVDHSRKQAAERKRHAHCEEVRLDARALIHAACVCQR